MPPQAIVALVGRPNVGKSSLFNRLVGERMAITDANPGTTRDYLLGQTHWNGIDFTVIDTGGIEINTALIDSSKPFIAAIRAQALEAASQADCILFLVDAMSGLTAADEEIAEILRRTRAPVILVANKIDDETSLGAELEAYSLGLGEVFPISAIHSLGVGDLLDAICERLKPQSQSANTDTSEQMHIAIIGRPNVGKSSLLNRLLGKERAIVSAHAGTTRDALDTQISWQKQPVTLIDTAGIRRRGKVTPGVEKYSVLRAKHAIDRSEVALLLMDAGQGVTEQDEHIAGMIKDTGCSLVLLVNKWDAIQRDTHTMHEMTLQIRAKLDFVPFAPIMFISALTGQRCSKVLETAFQVWQARFLRIQTAALNQLIRDALTQHSPPTRGNRRLKVRYAAQVSVNPPLILFHVNDRRLLHFSYERYLENRIRAVYDFLGTPLRFSFREGAR